MIYQPCYPPVFVMKISLSDHFEMTPDEILANNTLVKIIFEEGKENRDESKINCKLSLHSRKHIRSQESSLTSNENVFFL